MNFLLRIYFVITHCNRLLQYGSPAIPYRDEIESDIWLYNNTDHHEITISLKRPEHENISSPVPGKWYVTAFLPHVKKDKKIKEKVLIISRMVFYYQRCQCRWGGGG